LAKSGRLELRDNNFTDIIGLPSTTVTQSACNAIEFGEKRKIRAIRSFKVIEIGTN